MKDLYEFAPRRIYCTRIPVEETQATNGVVAFLEDQAEQQREQEEQHPSQPETPATGSMNEDGDEQEEEEEEEDSDDVHSIHSFIFGMPTEGHFRISKSSPRRQPGLWTSGMSPFRCS